MEGHDHKRPEDGNEYSGEEGHCCEDDVEHFDDGYDENLMGDVDDRKRLQEMSERQREVVLFQRAQDREVLLARFTVRKKLMQKSHSKDDTKDFKTIRTVGDEEGSNSETCKPVESLAANTDRRTANAMKRKETSHSLALERLAAERKRKVQDIATNNDSRATSSPPAKKSVAGKQRDSSCSSSSSSSDNSSSSSSDDEDEAKSDNQVGDDRSAQEIATEQEARQKQLTPISTAAELSRMRLSRFRLARWCHTPFFKDAIVGGFVKIGIGSNAGVSVYRIAEIIDVVETAKIYDIEDTRTNKGLKLRLCGVDRVYRMKFVSNHPIDEKDFNAWVAMMQKNNKPLPTLSKMEAKAVNIQFYHNYSYQDSDIEQMVKEKKRFEQQPTNFAVARADLLRQLEEAKEMHDNETISVLEAKISELTKQRMEKFKNSNPNGSVFDEINKRNRKLTTENVEAALKREAEENRQNGGDPFTRRRCLPIMVTKSRESRVDPELLKQLAERSAAATAMGSRAPEEPSSPSNNDRQTGRTASSGSGQDSHPSKDDKIAADLFSKHNFEIDIDLKPHRFGTPRPNLTKLSRPKSQAIGSSSSPRTDNPRDPAEISDLPSSANTRRALNMEDYKRMRGLL